MSTATINWHALNDLSEASLKGAVFTILQQAALEIQNGELDEPSLLGVGPRLAEIIEKRPELNGFREAVSALARSVGLWNYIDRTHADAPGPRRCRRIL